MLLFVVVLTRFREKVGGARSPNISTACYYFKENDVKAIRDYIQEGKDPDNIGGFITWLLEERSSLIGSVSFPSPWFDVGTRKALLQANSYYLRPIRKGYISPDTIVNEPVQIAEGAKISKNSILGPNVYIGEGVEVTHSNISNSMIMEGCNIQESVIPNSLIGPGCIIEAIIPETKPVICGPKSQWKDDLEIDEY
jgi:glucose-1-phosphate thymidylyltransferase